MIAVCLTTRGMVFTEVMDSLLRNLVGYERRIYSSFALPIPESLNFLVDKALYHNPTHILFVEEDTVFPPDGLNNMLKANADIACIDYAVEGWGCVTKDKIGNILWCGLGCTLVKREVFEKMEKPYFRIDKQLLLNYWPEIKWIDTNPAKTYGGQDIWFCMQAREKGFQIKQVEGECKHLMLKELGKREINNGLHQIGEREMIYKHQII